MNTVGKKLHAERKLALEGINLETFFFKTRKEGTPSTRELRADFNPQTFYADIVGRSAKKRDKEENMDCSRTFQIETTLSSNLSS